MVKLRISHFGRIKVHRDLKTCLSASLPMMRIQDKKILDLGSKLYL